MTNKPSVKMYESNYPQFKCWKESSMLLIIVSEMLRTSWYLLISIVLIYKNKIKLILL